MTWADLTVKDYLSLLFPFFCGVILSDLRVYNELGKFEFTIEVFSHNTNEMGLFILKV